MYDIKSDKHAYEHKLITKYIFQGLTIAQIAKEMKCCTSTVSNRMNTLFKKYNAKTRFEFILGVLGEIVRNNKNTINKKAEKIDELEHQLKELTVVLTNIILNKNHKEKFEYWINIASNKIQ